ncbi:YceI family protein [Lysobacter sp. TY2-98]|uniref:YceI family protein n=1 Tax=Lysobacter sp. TY2-98 TaxID=2290922 RepID=UPI0013B41400|nr:YceI family protein [Lysobacter sp. TY2-98]
MTPRILLSALLGLACGPGFAQALDTARSRIDFDLHTRIGSQVRGQFPLAEGRVDTLADGRRQVHMRLDARGLRIGSSDYYTRLARGPALFDVERYPAIEFTSDPYPATFAHVGGVMEGVLRMHGVEHRERFELAAATCTRPGYDCPILASGRVSRDDYGLDGWRWALADRVRFQLNVLFVD